MAPIARRLSHPSDGALLSFCMTLEVVSWWHPYRGIILSWDLSSSHWTLHSTLYYLTYTSHFVGCFHSLCFIFLFELLCFSWWRLFHSFFYPLIHFLFLFLFSPFLPFSLFTIISPTALFTLPIHIAHIVPLQHLIHVFFSHRSHMGSQF